ncbi:MAG: amidohydrolase, partial [Casimicrobiaceae bacterium]
MDLILRDAVVGERAHVDIGIVDGRIEAIAGKLEASGPQIDVGGRVVVPAFVETHLHLDKSCILDRCVADRGTLSEAIEQVSHAKRGFTADDV